MRVALLSAGPSLPQTFDPDARHDLRIGVNSAAAAYPVDWWACGDGATFARVSPVGCPAIFTMTADDGHLRRGRNPERLKRHRLETWGPVKRRLDAPGCWTNWSVTAGLVLAVDLGARSVEVFGHDMTGTTDLSGHELKKRAENWKRVHGDWVAVRQWADSRGVSVLERKPEVMACM